jgi:hypothetical protein
MNKFIKKINHSLLNHLKCDYKIINNNISKNILDSFNKLVKPEKFRINSHSFELYNNYFKNRYFNSFLYKCYLVDDVLIFEENNKDNKDEKIKSNILNDEDFKKLLITSIHYAISNNIEETKSYNIEIIQERLCCYPCQNQVPIQLSFEEDKTKFIMSFLCYSDNIYGGVYYITKNKEELFKGTLDENQGILYNNHINNYTRVIECDRCRLGKGIMDRINIIINF